MRRLLMYIWRLTGCMILCVVSVGLSGCGSGWYGPLPPVEARRILRLQSPMDAKDTLEAKILNGNISLTTNRIPECALTVTITVRAWTQQEAQAYVDSATNSETNAELNSIGRYRIGFTDRNGELTHRFRRAGPYLLIAAKCGYIPDFSIIKIKGLEPAQGRRARPAVLRS